MMKQRLDLLLVDRGLAHSRRDAQALIMSGRVTVQGHRQDKPGARIDQEAVLEVSVREATFVGRGGVKLAGALQAFGIDVTGLTAVDVGASTGGFTDCLLQHGAARVFAVDVGRGQLDWRLRNDPRVTVVEGLNARHISPDHLEGLGAGADIATLDVSFISSRLVLPRIPPLLRQAPASVSIVALVKPQFEVGRGKVGRGGIVRDPELRREAVVAVAGYALSIGLSIRGLARSPITGAEGNVEYFLHLDAKEDGMTTAEIDLAISRLIRQEPAHA